MVKLLKEIVISNYLRDLIIPLSTEEFAQLESNILAEGCREALILWDNGNELILVDGHNRHKICQKHGIPYETKTLPFETREEVAVWMLNNQLGRRNLNPDQLSYYRGLKYLSAKNIKGGYVNVKSKGQNELSTAERLAGEFKVSESTIKRDAKYAEGLELIAKSNPNLKNDILTGNAKFKKRDLALLAQAQDEKLRSFKNAADLYNKLSIIKDTAFKDIEQSLKVIEEDKTEASQKFI